MSKSTSSNLILSMSAYDACYMLMLNLSAILKRNSFASSRALKKTWRLCSNLMGD